VTPNNGFGVNNQSVSVPFLFEFALPLSATAQIGIRVASLFANTVTIQKAEVDLEEVGVATG